VKFIILEDKQQIIAKYIDNNFITLPALNYMYTIVPKALYGFMDWFVHALVYIKNVGVEFLENNNNLSWDESKTKIWDLKFLKTINHNTIELEEFTRDTFMEYALSEFIKNVNLFTKNRDKFGLGADVSKIHVSDLAAKADELANQGLLISKKEKEKEKKQAAKKVFENDKLLVVIPDSFSASCAYGAGTKWCTTSSKYRNDYDSYINKGTLYYIIDKEKNEKYATFMYPSGKSESFDAADN
jgi:hypothetical protein